MTCETTHSRWIEHIIYNIPDEDTMIIREMNSCTGDIEDAIRWARIATFIGVEVEKTFKELKSFGLSDYEAHHAIVASRIFREL